MDGLWAPIIFRANGSAAARAVGEVHDEVAVRDANGLHNAGDLRTQRVAPTGLALSDNTSTARPDEDWCEQRERRAIELKLQIILDEHDGAQLLADDAREESNIILIILFLECTMRVVPPNMLRRSIISPTTRSVVRRG